MKPIHYAPEESSLLDSLPQDMRQDYKGQVQHYGVLRDREATSPYALVRAVGPFVQQWHPQTRTWYEATWMLEYVFGMDFGAYAITDDEAELVKDAPTLAMFDKAEIEEILAMEIRRADERKARRSRD